MATNQTDKVLHTMDKHITIHRQSRLRNFLFIKWKNQVQFWFQQTGPRHSFLKLIKRHPSLSNQIHRLDSSSLRSLLAVKLNNTQMERNPPKVCRLRHFLSHWHQVIGMLKNPALKAKRAIWSPRLALKKLMISRESTSSNYSSTEVLMSN